MKDEKTLDILKQMVADGKITQEDAEKYCPELVESKDEKIRKGLINGFKFYSDQEYWGTEKYPLKIKDIIAYLEKQGEQKPTNEVKPKFEIGNFVKHSFFPDNTYRIKDIDLSGYYELESVDGIRGNHIAAATEEQIRLWTIQDAKDGDVLSYVTDKGDLWIMIYWSLCEPNEGNVLYHALFINDNFGDKGNCCISIDNLKPATKEQRDLLFQKMHEAGYEWDAEKKELKKIEQTSDNLPKGEDYGIDGLYAAVDILQKTLGKVDGYQTDDGILEHECAISAVKSLYEQKPAWGEEDESMLNFVKVVLSKHQNDEFFDISETTLNDCLSWFKDIKSRIGYEVNCTTTKEWSEEDGDIRDNIIRDLKRLSGDMISPNQTYQKEIQWLKSLRPQNTWKPSEEQMKALNEAMYHVDDSVATQIAMLIGELSKL